MRPLCLIEVMVQKEVAEQYGLEMREQDLSTKLMQVCTCTCVRAWDVATCFA